MASFFYSSDDSSQIDTHGRKRPLLTSVAGSGEAPTSDTQPTRRQEVSPPAQFVRARPLWQAWAMGVWRWVWDMDADPSAKKPAPTSGLRPVKAEFIAALWDLQSLQANQVRDQIETSRSLRELWHLRADVFKVISTHRGQIEAQLRLDALDSHFPVRASRRGDPGQGTLTTW